VLHGQAAQDERPAIAIVISRSRGSLKNQTMNGARPTSSTDADVLTMTLIQKSVET